MRNGVRHPIGWLLLKKGHAVPLVGLAPDDIKAARGSTIEHEDEDLKQTTGLNAIVDCLGFDGDFGDYKRAHWDRIQRIMAERGLREYCDLFEVPMNRMMFGIVSTMRRALADRIFFGPSPMPKRVFTGFGHDWDRWWLKDDFRPDLHVPDLAPTDMEEARRWVHRHRTHLLGFINFRGDQLLDIGKPGVTRFTLYNSGGQSLSDFEKSLAAAHKVAQVFRWFIDRREDGWVEVIPVTENLVLLGGPNGTYDLLWRNLRSTPPPAHAEPQDPFDMNAGDMPSVLLSEYDFETWNYFRLGAWEDMELYEAEKRYYAAGGAGQDTARLLAVRHYLESEGVFGKKAPLPPGQVAPSGFRAVRHPDGHELFVSDLITIDEMRKMMAASGWPERRRGDAWEPGNTDESHLPTAATWYDAQAYCGWMEMVLGVRVRLPNTAEYRIWFPEPRTSVPKPPAGLQRTRESELSERLPEPVRFNVPLRWKTSPFGVRAVDAWDIAEWVQDNWGYPIDPWMQAPVAPTTWGAYKGLKVGFRLVIERASATK